MARAIMVQGTMSNAGKSALCTGLCRIFRQDGYRVAPFKSQNMSRNAAVLPGGLEMARAQAVQAEAAGIPPDVRMNPVLLKPKAHGGCEVIVNGRRRCRTNATDYPALRESLIPDIMRSYEWLAAEYDVIVLEGAGSPAEINLQRADLSNMGMARLAAAPVLLAGDIDRGGVFAQLFGTVKLLDETEQGYIKALIINKYRGDKALLAPGISVLRERTGKPMAGIVPYLPVDIEDEDSLAEGERKAPFPTRAEAGQMAYKNRQYDLLADGLRENLDMKLLYRILEAGI